MESIVIGPIALSSVEILLLLNFEVRHRLSITDKDDLYLCLKCLQSTGDRQKAGLFNDLELLARHFSFFKAA